MPECRSPRRQACRFRHLRNLATDSTISAVGNGKFAFTADVTGLQTLNQTFRSPLLHTGAGTRSRRRLRASIQAISQIRRSSSTTTRPTILPAPGSRLRCATGNGKGMARQRRAATWPTGTAPMPCCPFARPATERCSRRLRCFSVGGWDDDEVGSRCRACRATARGR
jgi:hypothetical protein